MKKDVTRDNILIFSFYLFFIKFCIRCIAVLIDFFDLYDLYEKLIYIPRYLLPVNIAL